MTSTTGGASRPLPARLSLEGRRILVTGAASGIGKAAAHACAELGADLVLTDRASLDAIAGELAKAGSKVETVKGDLTEQGFVDGLVRGRSLHGLIHCAAILHRKHLAEDAEPRARFHQVMDINVRVPYELAQAVCNDLVARNSDGAIVLIGSVAGKTGGTSFNTPIDYSASKGAVHTIIRWLSRRVVGKGILVNGIAPGPIETPMTENNPLDAKALPRGRKGEAEEIGWLAALLQTRATGYVSGAVIDANGGTFVGG
jgi:3-oxoacyl-[acyl-carrier protein] reductase